MDKPKTVAELETELSGFYGTEKWHRHSILFKRLSHTDGMKYLADRVGCFWLLDIVGSVLERVMKKGEGFSTWKIISADSKAVVTADDGNGNILYTQKIPYTDFPEGEFKFFVAEGGPQNTAVAMLTSEY